MELNERSGGEINIDEPLTSSLGDFVPFPSDAICSGEKTTGLQIEKHLFYPKPLEFGKRRQKDDNQKAPSAISSAAWREFVNEKEQEKLRRAEEIQKRKEERKLKREEKEQTKRSKKEESIRRMEQRKRFIESKKAEMLQRAARKKEIAKAKAEAIFINKQSRLKNRK